MTPSKTTSQKGTLARAELSRSKVATSDGFSWESYHHPAPVACEFSELLNVREGVITAIVGSALRSGRPAGGVLDEVQSLVRRECQSGSTPAQITRSIENLYGGTEISPQDDVSLLVATVDVIHRTVDFANSGQPQPLLWDAARLVPSPLAGAQWQLPLGPGYRLFLYTAGLAEACGPQGVLESVQEHSGLPGAEFLAAMRARYLRYAKRSQPRHGLSMLWLAERLPDV